MKGMFLLVLAVGCTASEPTPSVETSIGNDVEGDSPTSPSAPTHAVLAAGPRYAMDVQIDDEYVYWVTNAQALGGSSIYRVPKTGGAVETLFVHTGRIYQIAVDDDFVYAPIYVQDAVGGQLLRIPKSGGQPTVLGDHMRYLYFVAVDDCGVYTSPLVTEDPFPEYELWRFSKVGNKRERLVSGLLGPDAMAIDGDSVYTTNTGNGLLLRAASEGGRATDALPGEHASRLAADADNLYFVSNAFGGCMGARIAGWSKSGSSLTDLGESYGCAMDLTATTRSVLTVESAGNVVEFPLDGSGRHVLVSGLATPHAVAAEPDGSAVYWVEFQSGIVGRFDL